VSGILTEKVGLNLTALSHWVELRSESNLNRALVELNVARVKVKLGLVDEALEILAQFDGDTDSEINKQIGFILTLAGYHDYALEQFKKAEETTADDYELAYAIGVSALRVGGEDELELAKEKLIECCEQGSSSIKIKSIKALTAIAFLTRDRKFNNQVTQIAKRFPDSKQIQIIIIELKVRQFIIRYDLV